MDEDDLTDPAAGPLFLEKQNYRRRRIADAVRLVPVVGLVLFLLPLLWPTGAVGTSAALIYLFSVWFLITLLGAVLSRLAARPMKDAQAPGDPPAPGAPEAPARGGP